MKYVALAVLLAVMQAPPPVPRKAADSPASTRDSVKTNATRNKAPSAKPESTAQTQPTGNNESRTDGKRQDDNPQSIRITEIPSVTVSTHRRDWVDWGFWVFNGLLVLVGALQVVLLCLTLQAIKRQANAMFGQLRAMRGQLRVMRRAGEQTERLIGQAQEQAEAAKKAVAIVISKERANISIGPLPLGLSSPESLQIVRYEVRISGLTDARILDRRPMPWSEIPNPTSLLIRSILQSLIFPMLLHQCPRHSWNAPQ